MQSGVYLTNPDTGTKRIASLDAIRFENIENTAETIISEVRDEVFRSVFDREEGDITTLKIIIVS